MIDFLLFIKWGNYALKIANNRYSGVYVNMKKKKIRK